MRPPAPKPGARASPSNWQDAPGLPGGSAGAAGRTQVTVIGREPVPILQYFKYFVTNCKYCIDIVNILQNNDNIVTKIVRIVQY